MLDSLTTQPEIITFGKYEGTYVTEIPDSFVQWMIKKFDPGTKWQVIAAEEWERREETGDFVEEKYER